MRLLPLLLGLSVVSAAPASAGPELAETLADKNAGATTPAQLDQLLQLQFAAGRWQAAEATIDRLAALRQPRQPWRVAALVPLRIFARAGRYEAAGAGRDAALARAFDELFAALSDTDMAEVLPWYTATIDRLRDAQTRAAKECAGVAVDACPKAADLVAARQALATWQYLLPASQPLIRANLARRFVVRDDLTIAMPDGVRIAAVMVRPRDAAKRTALLNFTIYARDDWAISDAVYMAARGYVGVVAYVRGKGRGQGPAVPYEHDGADAAATIDWLAAQPWSDGQVGMFSGSYNASTQWAALKHHPRALKAIATSASVAPGIDTPMAGNIFRNFIYPWPFYTTALPGLDDVNYGDTARWAALNRTWYATGRPYRDLEKIDGQPNPVFRTWLAHPAYDDYWQRLIPVGDEFAKIDIPVFVQTGYYDGGQIGALYYLREHLRYRPDADHRMLIGPYHHFAMNSGVLSSIGGEEVDRAAMLDLRAIRQQWFDHVFRKAPLPEALSGRVNFEVMGADRWRHVDSLAAMAEKRLRLYLTGTRDGDRLLFGTAPPTPTNAPPPLSVDLADRQDVDVTIPDGQLDTRNSLVFATAPFAQGIDVTGAFTGRFLLTINKRDVDLGVSFLEQRADGRYFPLAYFMGRASYVGDRTRRRLLVPGQLRRLDFESQVVTARRLAPGSRIIALVGVLKQPDQQINYGTGRDVSDESIADAQVPLTLRWAAGSWLEIGTADRARD